MHDNVKEMQFNCMGTLLISKERFSECLLNSFATLSMPPSVRMITITLNK